MKRRERWIHHISNQQLQWEKRTTLLILVRYGVQFVERGCIISVFQVTIRFRVQPSACIVVPSTFEPNQDAEFLLRVFVNGQITGTLLS